MSELNERLDNLKQEIQQEEFLEGKGLSNEVNIRIFCYDPKEEMTVRHFIEQLMVDQSLECHLIQCNLYQIFLKICDEKRITSGAPAMEEKRERIICCSRYSVLQITRLLWNRYNTDHITRGMC